ncbi:DEAD/DEAH box helicase [Marinilactibacillus psychrotolerans]|uniref:DEAD/DEAH box helicase n=1 Tax=Marinilactibacillus psychrotolerans TaxID=191770 RepID=A0A5R9BWQ1_9LACT|nr:DEAD/DEAH box helicase [Marinilactibacillus psychrotolerans]TLQ04723.1 DEAD/DEAH box helicase [Marinilactibacillus psychrotolerans]
MQLRPYQGTAKEKVLLEWEAGHKRTLLVLPTGTGKTIVFSKIIEECVRQGKRILVMAHRGELLDQAADKLEKSTGLKTAKEKAEETSIGSWERVVVGSVQSMMQVKRLSRFKPDHFDVIIIDEAHHALSSSYQLVLNHFEEADVLGVTATPDRGDMKNLGSYFESLAYEYTLPKAIKEGYLSPIKALTLPIHLDITGVKQSAGDFSAGQVGSVLDPYLQKIAEEMVKHCMDRKTVVFLPLVKTSQKFRDILNQLGFKAAEVNGSSKDREQVLKDFESGKYNVLCNSMLLTEGWDCPSVDTVVVLRPTKVRSLYSQMVGRGTRLYPGKEELLLLDFLWHTDRHELVHPAHLIAEDAEVAKAATKMIEEAGVPVDIEEVQEAAAEEATAQREEALAKKLEQLKRKKKRLVDPLQFAMSIEDKDLANYVPMFGQEAEPPSADQLKQIEKAGIDPTEVDSKGKADKILNHVNQREANNLSSAKQIKQLSQRGYQNVESWSFDQASKLIKSIAVNKWRTPHTNPQGYVPE